MRIYKTGVAGYILAGAIALIMLVHFTSHGTAKSEKKKEKVTFASVEVAYRAGIGAYRAGKIEIALPGLEHAAKHNNLTAMFLLARLHSGHLAGLPPSKRKPLVALRYYEILAKKLFEVRYRYPHRVARVSADVFIALADYYRDGLKEANITPNDEAAVRLYRHAAANYNDPVAEYRFALALRHGRGVAKNFKLAVRWFHSSAKKNYAPAQAHLGLMLWNGQGARVDRSRGLALLRLAMEYSSKADRQWIEGYRSKMESYAGEKTKNKARQLVILWQRQFGPPKRAEATMLMSKNSEAEKTKKVPSTTQSANTGTAKGYFKVEQVYKGNNYITIPAKNKERGNLINVDQPANKKNGQ